MFRENLLPPPSVSEAMEYAFLGVRAGLGWTDADTLERVESLYDPQ